MACVGWGMGGFTAIAAAVGVLGGTHALTVIEDGVQTDEARVTFGEIEMLLLDVDQGLRGSQRAFWASTRTGGSPDAVRDPDASPLALHQEPRTCSLSPPPLPQEKKYIFGPTAAKSSAVVDARRVFPSRPAALVRPCPGLAYKRRGGQGLGTERLGGHG